MLVLMPVSHTAGRSLELGRWRERRGGRERERAKAATQAKGAQ